MNSKRGRSSPTDGGRTLQGHIVVSLVSLLACALWSLTSAHAFDPVAPVVIDRTAMETSLAASSQPGSPAQLDPNGPAEPFYVPYPQAAAPAPEFAPATGDQDAPFDLHRIYNESFVGSWLNANRIQIGGYWVQSFTGNPDSPNDHFNGPVTWTDRSNEYQLNEKWAFAQRATNTLDSDWDIGGRFDFISGSNARFFVTSGTIEDVNSARAFYGVAIPQLYGEIAYRQLKVKLGHFLSPAGFFTANTALNFFTTVPYTYQYGEPFTHTGGLATLTLTDRTAISGGIIRGWNNSGNANPHLGGLAGVSHQITDRQELAFVVIYSKELSLSTTTSDGFSPRYLQSLVYSNRLTERLTYVAQSDFGSQTNATATGHTARWYGLNQYLFFQQTAEWAWGVGGEWFRDEEGFRVGGFLPLPPTNDPSIHTRGLSKDRNGYAGSFFDLTFGPRWTPNTYVVVRPNVRFDWFSGSVNNAGGLKPFDNGNKNSQVLLGIDVILNF